jgi:hypothetical protein
MYLLKSLPIGTLANRRSFLRLAQIIGDLHFAELRRFRHRPPVHALPSYLEFSSLWWSEKRGASQEERAVASEVTDYDRRRYLEAI